MSKMVQIRNMPDAVHRTLKARAALAGVSLSDYLLADSRRAIEVILNGLSGPITVNGKPYDSVMPPLSQLNDDEVAHILTYVNNGLGNQGDRILPTAVSEVRATTKRPPGAGH